MNPRTFQGRTMAEALASVKRHFGPHAVILSTRTVSRGLLGLASQPLVEITAARESPALADSGRARRLHAAEKSDPASATSRPRVPAPVGSNNGSSSECVMREVGTLKSLVTELVQETRRLGAKKSPKALYSVYRSLVENAVAEDLAATYVRRLEDELGPESIKEATAVRKKLAQILVESLPTAGPIAAARPEGPCVAALIGPTGVGKTTTIAKLAANFSLRERKKVGLITLDTYRIAAVEQLRTYAQIMDVPLQVAMSPAEYQDAVQSMADRDVILVDSAGRSQRDAMKINELREFFTAAPPHEVHLVLSSASCQRVIDQAIHRFREVGFDRVIFTKMDEAVGFGVILGALKKVDAKLSYITTGQDVPADIEVGQPAAIAGLIMGA